MCEIAVLDPEQADITTTHQIAGTFHEEQGDGLGVMAVFVDEDGFDYKVYKSTTPHWQTLFTFLQRNYDDAWRFVLHGRSKTSGEVNHETSHPLHVDCDLCEFDWVVHNGHVRQYEDKQEDLISEGHDLHTGVDTEVIAHKVQMLPDSVKHNNNSTFPIYGNLNYILCSENGILVRMGEDRYHMSDDFTVTCSYSRFTHEENDHGFVDDNSNEWMLIEPPEEEGAEPEIEVEERTTYSRTRTTTSAHGTSAGQTWTDNRNAASQGSGVSAGSAFRSTEIGRVTYSTAYDRVTIRYDNLADYENIAVAKVAPGVVRISDLENGEDDYVFERDDPKLYYWYLPDEEPEDFEAEEVHQATIEDFPVEAASRAVAQEVSETVADEVEELDDAQEIQDAVWDAAEVGTTAALGAHVVKESA